MMPLADSAGGIVWFFILLIFAIGKIMEKVASAKKAPPATIRPSTSTRSADSEEERTRKFLEALGLPAQPLATKPAPLRPSSMPQPPALPTEMRGSRESLPHTPPSSVKRPSRSEVEAQRLERKRRQAEERRAKTPPQQQEVSIENIHLPELESLKVPEVQEFRTRASEVSAIPFEAKASVAGQLYRREESARLQALAAFARSPQALRQVILLREIIGPPRSLQSYPGAASFVTPS